MNSPVSPSACITEPCRGWSLSFVYTTVNTCGKRFSGGLGPETPNGTRITHTTITGSRVEVTGPSAITGKEPSSPHKNQTKNFENQHGEGSDSSNFLEQCPDSRRGKALARLSYQPRVVQASLTLTISGSFCGFPISENVIVAPTHLLPNTGSNLFPLKMREPHEPNNTISFHSAVEVKNRYSQHELMCHQCHDSVPSPPSPSLQEKPTCCPPSFTQTWKAGGFQDYDPKIWGDLPFFKSLNKFSAVIESEIAPTQTDASSRKHPLDNGIDKLHANHSNLSVIPRTTRTLHIPPIALRSSQATVKANSGKVLISSCEANPTPSVQKESQLGNIAEAVSVRRNGREVSKYFLPNALSDQISSSKGLGITSTLWGSTRIPPQKAAISLKHSTSKSDHSCLDIKYFDGCGEKLLEMSKKLTTLCSRRYNAVSNLCNLENTQYSRWLESQGDSLRICRKLTYPLEALCSNPNKSTTTLKEMAYGHIDNNLTQNGFPGDRGSCNPSANLDDHAKEMDQQKSQKNHRIFCYNGYSLAESHQTESDFSLSSFSENSSQSSQKLSLQDMSASMCPKTLSWPDLWWRNSESDFEDNQDFVPCSRSTPVAEFYQETIV
ncbi:LOW QUALITY PROTEIN: DNA damage-induced apoptosis suppressor protein [Rhynchonycteris naso]